MMKMSDETRAVDMIRAGVETKANQEFREAGEGVAMAKAFVKAAFVDLQTTMFMNTDYFPHRVEQFLEQTKRFENALNAYKKEENKLLVLHSKVTAPVGVAAVKPSDLMASDETTNALKELELSSDEAGV
jgi:hypothetical protein